MDGVPTAIVVGLLTVALWWNAVTLGLVGLPDDPDLPVDSTDRRWDMFAPHPVGVDGWYVVPGRLESGARVDAFHRSPVTWDRPPDIAAASRRRGGGSTCETCGGSTRTDGRSSSGTCAAGGTRGTTTTSSR
jgi:hypothetical protein